MGRHVSRAAAEYAIAQDMNLELGGKNLATTYLLQIKAIVANQCYALKSIPLRGPTDFDMRLSVMSWRRRIWIPVRESFLFKFAADISLRKGRCDDE